MSDSGVLTRLEGLERWTMWFREQLRAAQVDVVEPEVFESGARWGVHFSSGETAVVYVNEPMLFADGPEFTRITNRLEAHAWVGALSNAGPEELHLSNWSE